MRYTLLIAAASMLLSCKASEPTTTEQPQAHTRPMVVGNDTIGSVTTVEVGKKSQVTLQIGGTGNTASTPTDTKAPVLLGQGNSATTKPATTPWLLYVLLVGLSVLVGWLLRRKLAT
jgi:hypothetical protein